jgi:hypothetical protein
MHHSCGAGVLTIVNMRLHVLDTRRRAPHDKAAAIGSSATMEGTEHGTSQQQQHIIRT